MLTKQHRALVQMKVKGSHILTKPHRALVEMKVKGFTHSYKTTPRVDCYAYKTIARVDHYAYKTTTHFMQVKFKVCHARILSRTNE
jgi:hypothetical protein